MNILGITHPISLSSAACLLKNGKLVAFTEEERFTRIKHSPYMPANKSIDYCLKAGNIKMEDIDYIAIGYDTFLNVVKENIIEKIQTVLQRRAIKKSLNSKKKFYNEKVLSIPYMIQCFISDYYQGLLRLPFNYREKRVKFIRHHLAHAASSYYLSGFDKACIISADGGGGQEAGILAVGERDKIHTLKQIPPSSSLGNLYAVITKLLGFEPHDGEGKVMGLSSYKKGKAEILPFVSFIDGIALIDQEKMKNYLLLIKSRLQKDPLSKESVDLAASLQETIEKAYVYMGNYLFKKTGIRNFCLTGGVSLNCLANTKLYLSGCVDNLFIQPASHDAGTALGAALQVYVDIYGKRPGFVFEHAYYGPGFSNENIEAVIKKCEIPFWRKYKNIEQASAKLLQQGKIIGWFQGRMEIGPRALGNRSILANPSIPLIKDAINERIKGREPWRPFAPSILNEYADRYLKDVSESPFMILESRVKPDHQKEIIAATHVDGTVRPQTVSKKTNQRYWNLINEFKKLSGIPAVLNTSFNLAGEPIVCTPQDAISTFYRAGLDYLIMGNYLIAKEPFEAPTSLRSGNLK